MKGRKRVIIIAGGLQEKKFFQSFIKKNDLLICADGGWNLAKVLKIKPYLIIGDLDSIKKAIPKDIIVKKYSPYKDKSDLELAIDEAFKMTPKEIIILGALGKRLDHLLGNIFLLIKAEKKGFKAKILSKSCEIFLVKNKEVIKGKKDEIISLFSLAPKTKDIFLEGFKYPFKGENLSLGSSRGLSNILISSCAKIKFKKGLLLAVRNTKK
ncbi:MAG: thiamine diphosphokinase [Armatimonadetes bacterium]|nr:thiamine diphosphokinase [Armatimonadota bacterium]